MNLCEEQTVRTIQLMPILIIILFVIATFDGDTDDGTTETPERVHRFVNGSVTIKLPRNWVADEDEFTVGKLVVISDASLTEARVFSEGAMGVFRVEELIDAGSPAEILVHKLFQEGGPPEGAEIETIEINDHPAARMVAMDKMFGQDYLWHATVTQIDDEFIVFASFTGLGKYETNGVIDAVVETITVDRLAFKAALDAG